MWVDYLLAFSVQFFPRTQIQSARPAIPTNTASIRAGAQPPTAAVYPTNQPIMMTMAPMPFPSPQPAQYYIPQVTHTETHIPLALTNIEQGSPDWFSTGLGGLSHKLAALLCSVLRFLSFHLQYRHGTPYVGPPQQYSVQPPGSGTFYPGPGPGEYAAPYRE